MDTWAQIISWNTTGIYFLVQESDQGIIHRLDGVTWDAKGY